jgi:hypothetical protein
VGGIKIGKDGWKGKIEAGGWVGGNEGNTNEASHYEWQTKLYMEKRSI